MRKAAIAGAVALVLLGVATVVRRIRAGREIAGVVTGG